MHLGPALACALLGLVVSPLLARLVADPPLWAPSDDEGITLEGRALSLVTAVLVAGTFAVAGWTIGTELELVAVLVLFAGLVVVSLVDLTIWRIPDRVLLPTYLVGLVLIVAVSLEGDEIDAVWWALGCSAGSYAFLRLPRLMLGSDAMGGGDIKLAALMGLYLGWRGFDPLQAVDAVRLTLVGLVAGAVLGIIFGLPTALRHGWRTHFPFGPALALATAAGVLWPAWFLSR
jgi:leader peptidase (prepilin peptidase)/N-methyltransferase